MRNAGLAVILAVALLALALAEYVNGIGCAMPFGVCYRPNGAVRLMVSAFTFAPIAITAWLAFRPPSPAIATGTSIALVLWLGFAAVGYAIHDSRREDLRYVIGFAGNEPVTAFHVQLAQLFFPGAAASAALLSFAQNVPRTVKIAAGAAAGLGIAAAFSP